MTESLSGPAIFPTFSDFFRFFPTFQGAGQDHAFLVYRYISEDDENSRWDYKAFNCSAVPWQALLGTAAGKNL